MTVQPGQPDQFKGLQSVDKSLMSGQQIYTLPTGVRHECATALRSDLVVGGATWADRRCAVNNSVALRRTVRHAREGVGEVFG